jgi:hypothetical protein
VLVNGKCPGPQNFKLCIVHKHVVDSKTGEVVADSVGEFSPPGLKAGPGAKPAGDKSENLPTNECVLVSGKCPGPGNFKLCKTHGHVVDTKTGEVIAESLATFEPPGGKGAKGGSGLKPGPAAAASPKSG